MHRAAAQYVRPGVWRRPGLRGVCPLAPPLSSWRCYSASAPVAARDEKPDDDFSRFCRYPWYQMHPAKEPITRYLFDRFDNWFSSRFLTPESLKLRRRRYETLASRVNMRTDEEIQVPRPKPLARSLSMIIDNMVVCLFLSIPIVGLALFPVAQLVKETYRARWDDRASIGRRLLGLRVISLSGPDSEASALAVRVFIPQAAVVISFVCGPMIPYVGEAIQIAAVCAVFLVLPLQACTGNGRTWVDHVANTQVIPAEYCE